MLIWGPTARLQPTSPESVFIKTNFDYGLTRIFTGGVLRLTISVTFQNWRPDIYTHFMQWFTSCAEVREEPGTVLYCTVPSNSLFATKCNIISVFLERFSETMHSYSILLFTVTVPLSCLFCLLFPAFIHVLISSGSCISLDISSLFHSPPDHQKLPDFPTGPYYLTPTPPCSHVHVTPLVLTSYFHLLPARLCCFVPLYSSHLYLNLNLNLHIFL